MDHNDCCNLLIDGFHYNTLKFICFRTVPDSLVGWLVGWLVDGKFVQLRGRGHDNSHDVAGDHYEK